MAHYALIDSDGIVVQVITGINEDVIQIDENGNPVGGSSEAWEHFYASRPWFSGLICKRTSYNGNIRKNYAGIGWTYDSHADAFIPPQCHEIAELNLETYRWECAHADHAPIV
jgi:hypothetical protein